MKGIKLMQKKVWVAATVLLSMLLFVACAQTTGNKETNSVKEPKQKQEIDKEDMAGERKVDLHEIMFTSKQSNWGEVYSLDDYYCYTTWDVYYDGTVEMYTFYHISGYTDKSIWELSDDEYKELTKLLNGKFQKEYNVEACDGDNLDMTYFDKKGREIHQFSGYIYGVKALERIQEILNSTEDKEVITEPMSNESSEKMLEISLYATESREEGEADFLEWILYHDGRLESNVRFGTEESYESHEYQVSETDFSRIRELLENNFMVQINQEEGEEMWFVNSYNILGDGINGFYGDIDKVDFLAEIRDIFLSYDSSL